MGRGGEIASLRGFRKRRRIRSEDESSGESDEEYVLGEDECGDYSSDELGASVSGYSSDESFDSVTVMCSSSSDDEREVARSKPRKGFLGRRELRVDRGNSRVSRVSDDEEDGDDEARKVVRLKPRKGFPSRKEPGFKWPRRRPKDSRALDDENDDDVDWNVIPTKPRKCFSGQRLGIKRSHRLTEVLGNGGEVEEKEFSGLRKSSVRQSQSISNNLEEDGEDGDEIQTSVESKPIKGFSGQWKSRAMRSQTIYRVLDDEEDDENYMPDVDDHVDTEEESLVRSDEDGDVLEENEKDERRKRRAVVNSDSNCIVSRSSHIEHTNSEEERDFVRETVSDGGLTTCLTSPSLLNRLQDDMSWNHLRRKRSVMQSRSVYTVSHDEESMPDADDYVEHEKENQVWKRTRVRLQGSASRSMVSYADDFVVEDRIMREENKKKSQRRNKSAVVHSDSGFDTHGSLDAEYTVVSEEERDSCGNSTTSPRSPLLKRLQVDLSWHHLLRKRSVRNRKGELYCSRPDLGKQVCGICLSEEHNGIVRGILNSCIHYFCFTCIMEWSKVESRCPVCKQRFSTISKPARWDVGIGLTKEVISVLERDQVYQPSEEEMRGYFDPYENVVCAVCQQGVHGDLLLLCDICDSAAHTYCVGLGLEVPEGNWYCEGCMPSNPRYSDMQVPDYTCCDGLCIEQSGNGINAECLESHVHFTSSSQQHSVSLPEQPFPSEIDVLSPPRCPMRQDRQAASVMSEAGPSGPSTITRRHRIHIRIPNNR
ncbi:uncharacterized protein LOC131231284 [Magnolia sinica]|uniref:uncharacterized protein LOC131231284 n=1 Tax=Magnolia sinica TaxID=86752 RepID=UPI00265871C5|nr:uncharacterized protein LOC131231284 [Magnolia sinica]